MTIALYKNSFVTMDEAQAYFDERFDSQIWLEISNEDKEKLLITATKKINTFDFCGDKEDKSQDLEFPRDFGTPQDIKDAVCEEALQIAKNEKDPHAKNKEQGIASISLGAGSVSYNAEAKSEESKLLTSAVAIYLVKKWTKKGFSFPS